MLVMWLLIEGSLTPESYHFGSGAELVRFLKWIAKSKATRRKPRPVARIIEIREV